MARPLARLVHGPQLHGTAVDDHPVVERLIEVADTTLIYDLEVKMPLYARAGIPEAWVVDPAAGQIRVHRDPVGAAYTNVRMASRGDSIELLHFPHVSVSIDDILGPQ